MACNGVSNSTIVNMVNAGFTWGLASNPCCSNDKLAIELHIPSLPPTFASCIASMEIVDTNTGNNIIEQWTPVSNIGGIWGNSNLTLTHHCLPFPISYSGIQAAITTHILRMKVTLVDGSIFQLNDQGGIHFNNASSILNIPGNSLPLCGNTFHRWSQWWAPTCTQISNPQIHSPTTNVGASAAVVAAASAALYLQVGSPAIGTFHTIGTACYRYEGTYFVQQNQMLTGWNVTNGVASLAGNTCSTGCNISVGIYGCTDPNALNYDPTATVDDGTCVYCVDGCTDPTAINYDPAATCDDGSCVYSTYGCTDQNALNYNPTAQIDDGSCVYDGDPGPGTPDPDDPDPVDPCCIVNLALRWSNKVSLGVEGCADDLMSDLIIAVALYDMITDIEIV